MRPVARAALILVAATLTACPDPQTCVARGTATTLTGVTTYAIGVGQGVSLSSGVVVYDYDEACSYDAEEFPIAVGDCTLWAQLTQGPEAPTRYFPGNPDAYAELEPGQTCALPLRGETVALTLASGSIGFARGATTILFSGTIAARDARADAPGESIEWQFLGNGWPQ